MLLEIADGLNSLVQFITVLVIFIIVLGVTLYVTRWVGKYQKMQNSGKNIDILESARISPSACVEILRVGDKYIAVAVAKDNVSFLCEVEKDDLVLEDDGLVSAPNFGTILNKVRESIPSKNPVNNDEE